MKTNHVSVALLQAAVLIALVFHAAVSWAANAYPPEYMTYQGFVADGNGDPLGNTNTGPKNYDVIFRIWTDPTAGTRLWSEQQTVTIDKGYFSVLLGEGSTYQTEPHPALSTLFTNVANASDRYIELTVKGIGPGATPQDVTILPRLRLLTSPYAFLARTAVAAQNIVNNVNSNILTVSGTNIGISKPNPTSALDVNGAVTASSASAGTIYALSAAYVNALTVTNAATVNGALTANTFTGNGANINNLNANNLVSGTVADARLSAYVAKLNASSQSFAGSNTFTGAISFGSAVRQMLNLFGTAYAIGVQSYTVYNRSTDHFAWYKGGQHSNNELDPGTGGTCLMSLTKDGYLGIGTTVPDAPLAIKSGGSGNMQWLSFRTNNTTKWHINNQSNGLNIAESGVADARLFLRPGGKVGINNNNPTATLDIMGDIKVLTMPLGGQYTVSWDIISRSFCANGASSRRYKENIRPMEADWSALLGAQPITFTYIGKPDQPDFGFIAEDFDALGLKPLVIYDQAGRPDGIHYNKIAIYLLQIVKAQQHQLNEKNARLEALEQSVAELKAMVNALAEKVKTSGK